jgi:peptidyl-prolyl cis-trans isomerase D
MALFETMRENTKIILWITVVAFVGLIFLAWGADFTSRRSGRAAEAGVLARVNGERILYTEYADQLAQARTNYESQTGKQPDDAVDLMLQANTWTNMIDRVLIRQEARRLGITVTDREVAIALMNNPPPEFMAAEAFQTDGKFDINKYRQYLVSSPDTRALEAQHRELVAADKIRMLMFAGIKVSEGELRERWLDDNDKINVAYAMVPYHKLLTDVEPTDEELTAYLRDHAEQYAHPARIALDYIRVDKTISAEDSADALSEIQEAYADYQRGEDFGMLVKDYTQAPAERCGGETAAWLTRAQITEPNVAEAAFTLPVGEVSGILRSTEGFHTVRVEDRKTEDGVEKVKIAEIFIPLKMSIETNAAIRDRLIDLADSVHEAFSEAVTSHGYQMRNTGLFDRTGFIPGLSRVTAAKDFAAHAKPNQTSRPIEVGDAWYLLHVSDVRPPEPATLEEVRPRVRNDLLAEKRKVEARTHAEAILASCRQGVGLEAAAATDPLATYGTAADVTRLGFVRGIGSDPAVTGAAFTQGTGLVPYVVTGAQGAYVLDVTGHAAPADSLFASQRATVMQGLLREKRNRVLNDWMEELRQNARIEDFRPAVTSM